MFSRKHVLESEFARGDLVLSRQCHKGNALGVGVAHLFFHLGFVGIDFCPDALLARLRQNRQAVFCLFFSKVDEKQLSAVYRLFWIEVKGVEHVVDAICAKRDAYAAEPWHAEDARQVVIPAASRDASHGGVERFHFENGSRVIVESAGQREIQLYFVVQSHFAQGVQDETQLFNAFESSLACGQHVGYRVQFLVVVTLHGDNGLQLADGFFADAVVSQLLVHAVKSNLVQFVDGHGDVHYFVGFAYHFRDAREQLAIVDFYLYTNPEAGKYGVYYLHQLHFVEQGV